MEWRATDIGRESCIDPTKKGYFHHKIYLQQFWLISVDSDEIDYSNRGVLQPFARLFILQERVNYDPIWYDDAFVSQICLGNKNFTFADGVKEHRTKQSRREMMPNTPVCLRMGE